MRCDRTGPLYPSMVWTILFCVLLVCSISESSSEVLPGPENVSTNDGDPVAKLNLSDALAHSWTVAGNRRAGAALLESLADESASFRARLVAGKSRRSRLIDQSRQLAKAVEGWGRRRRSGGGLDEVRWWSRRRRRAPARRRWRRRRIPARRRRTWWARRRRTIITKYVYKWKTAYVNKYLTGPRGPPGPPGPPWPNARRRRSRRRRRARRRRRLRIDMRVLTLNVPGPMGAAGADGTPGRMGRPAPPGLPGIPGWPGEPGNPARPGPPGAPGMPGVPGPAGYVEPPKPTMTMPPVAVNEDSDSLAEEASMGSARQLQSTTVVPTVVTPGGVALGARSALTRRSLDRKT